MSPPPYQLSAQLAGHRNDVRAVSYPEIETVISSSRDNTVVVWHDLDETPPKFNEVCNSFGGRPVNSLTFIHRSTAFPEGLIVSGRQDGTIQANALTARSPDYSKFFTLDGHTENVCALSVAPNGKWVVSGSWDGVARVWNMQKRETDLLLRHDDTSTPCGSVLAVLARDQQTVLTGGADGGIRLFDLRTGKDGEVWASRRIATPAVVRSLCPLRNHAFGATLASAGNDGVIRLWNDAYEELAQLHGHENFVYSLACLSTGEVVSCGEDRTLRVWDGTSCVQVIVHPAVTVWSVAVSPETDDLATGASDNIVRVFSRRRHRSADAGTIALFEDSVKAWKLQRQQLDGSVTSSSPSPPSWLAENLGGTEGQMKLIREADGRVCLYTWDSHGLRWIGIGTVIDWDTGNKKIEFQGREYDYVFDVDITEGQPPIKLPYNRTDNVYERAKKFLDDNMLPVVYLDQVARFITDNVPGAGLPQTSDEPVAIDTPKAPDQQRLPHLELFFITRANLVPMHKKTLEVNQELIIGGNKHVAMNPSEEKVLAGLIEQLKLANTASNTTTTAVTSSSSGSASPAPATTSVSASVSASSASVSAAISQTVYPEHAIRLVVKLATQWPYNKRLAGLDLLRFMVQSESVAKFETDRRLNIVDLVLASAFDTGDPNLPLNDNIVMMALRVVVNLFSTAHGRGLVVERRIVPVVDAMKRIAGLDEHRAVPVGRGNRNVQFALAASCLNYSVRNILEQQEMSRQVSARTRPAIEPEMTAQLARVMEAILAHNDDPDVLHMCLLSLGNVLTLQGKYHEMLRQFEIAVWLHGTTDKSSRPQEKELIKECLAVLAH